MPGTGASRCGRKAGAWSSPDRWPAQGRWAATPRRDAGARLAAPARSAGTRREPQRRALRPVAAGGPAGWRGDGRIKPPPGLAIGSPDGAGSSSWSTWDASGRPGSRPDGPRGCAAAAAGAAPKSRLAERRRRRDPTHCTRTPRPTSTSHGHQSPIRSMPGLVLRMTGQVRARPATSEAHGSLGGQIEPAPGIGHRPQAPQTHSGSQPGRDAGRGCGSTQPTSTPGRWIRAATRMGPCSGTLTACGCSAVRRRCLERPPLAACPTRWSASGAGGFDRPGAQRPGARRRVGMDHDAPVHRVHVGEHGMQ
jgi:hypothetical protein